MRAVLPLYEPHQITAGGRCPRHQSAPCALKGDASSWLLTPPPIVFDDDNPEWSDAVARARPIGDFPALAAAFPGGAKPRGRPKGSITSEKSLVSLRIDNDILERFRATGPGWQSRINDALRQAEPSG